MTRILMACCCLALSFLVQEVRSQETPRTSPFPCESVRKQPQWRTGPRLLQLGQTIQLTLLTKEEFPDYAICLWDVPAPFTTDRSKIESNAKEVIPVKNTAGEFHLVLRLDLKPNQQLTVRVRP